MAQADEISSSWQQSSVADLISTFIWFFLTCPVCFFNMSNSIINKQSQQQNSQPRVAVSACLLGQRVRYDGNQKQHAFVCRQLQKWLTLEAICPEVEIGMGVPRPPIMLIEVAGRIKAVGVDRDGLDVTQKLNRFGSQTAHQLSDLDAYIFKARSPSCGVTSTPIKHSDDSSKKGAGLYAAQIIKQLPLLPVVEESRLESIAQQVNFLQRLAAHWRWRMFVNQAPGWSELEQFHHDNRFSLMAHGIGGLRGLNTWLTEHRKNGPISKSHLQIYALQYMAQFSRQASRRRHVLVLVNIAKLLRPIVSEKQYDGLFSLIDQFRQAKRSLYSVISQLRKHQDSVSLQVLERQAYFDISTEIWRWLYKKQ